MDRIYLDYAAATPMDPEVLATMQPYFTQQFFNPSATYLAGRDIRRVVNEARTTVAAHLGCRPAEVVFTAGATEANNLAISGVMNNFPDHEVLVSSVEHESVLAPAKRYKHRLAATDHRGLVDLAKLGKMIGPKTVLVSVMYVNNELGTVQPLRDIAQIISEIRKQRLQSGDKTPLYLHSDAAQAGNFFDLHVSRLGVDLMSLNGGKIYGPKQSGALYIKAGLALQPLIVGGGQEYGLRSGTENVAGIVGLAKALELAQSKKTDEAKRLSELRKTFEEKLLQLVPGATINGSSKHRAPHIISVTFPGADNERLMMQLDEEGIACAVGSACSASSDEPSHVLSAIGLSDDEARSTLRFSMGCQTTKQDVDHSLKILSRILR